MNMYQHTVNYQTINLVLSLLFYPCQFLIKIIIIPTWARGWVSSWKATERVWCGAYYRPYSQAYTSGTKTSTNSCSCMITKGGRFTLGHNISTYISTPSTMLPSHIVGGRGAHRSRTWWSTWRPLPHRVHGSLPLITRVLETVLAMNSTFETKSMFLFLIS